MQKLYILSLCAAISASAASLTVSSGGNLQSALNQAVSGDVITLQAGATFTGHFTVPANSGNNLITVQSSDMASLPTVGHRVDPSYVAHMAKIMSPDASPALSITGGSNSYYRFQGLEFTIANGYYVQDLVQFGNGGESSYANLPHHLTLDRCYLHTSNAGGKRGVAMNSGLATVENSYIVGFTSATQDTQAICGWNGPGPFRILNNYFEATGEEVAFGGATPAIYGVIPSNITISHNTFFKPPSWRTAGPNGTSLFVKNMIEFKNAHRATIDSNTMTNNWVGADQKGFAILLNVRDEGGQVPWATVDTIDVLNNHIVNADGGIFVMGHDGDGGGVAYGMDVYNNLLEGIGSFGGDGRLWQVQAGAHDITFQYNTAFQSGPYAWAPILVGAGGSNYNITFNHNIQNNGSGIAGDNGTTGATTISTMDQGGSFANNVIIGGSAANYPAGNYYTASASSVGFSSNYYQVNSGQTYTGFGANLNVPVGLPTGFVKVINKNSGKCLDYPTWSGTNNGLLQGSQLQQYSCSGFQSQVFEASYFDDGWLLTIEENGLVLGVQGGASNLTAGAPILGVPAMDDQSMLMAVTAPVGGYWNFSPKSSNQSVDVGAASTADGAGVIQWPYFGGDNELWQLSPL